jgi:DNA-binding GntR family transcriptional regulator
MTLMPSSARPKKRLAAARSSLARSPEQRSLSESVYQQLLQGILSGRYPAGAVLSELALAREFEVSRTPVHDALRQLAKDGLVERQQKCRARVAGITSDDVFEIFEMRKLLEGPAAEMAATRMDARQLAPLKVAAATLQSAARSKQWAAQWAEFDDLFHSTIAKASGNRRLAQDIGRYRLLHKGLNRAATDFDPLQQALREHLAILAALQAKDGPLARRLMVEHVAVWQEHFIRSIGHIGDADVKLVLEK